jgi:hypothetical protein
MEKVLNFEIRILGLFRLPAGRQGFRYSDLGFLVNEWA